MYRYGHRYCNNMAVHKVGVLILTNYFLGIYASHHWKVTENGRISSQVENSGFPLIKQDDLWALLEQEQRLKAACKLYKQLVSLKTSIDRQWAKIEREGDLEKRLYSSDIDCLLGEIPLSQHSLNTEFLDYGQGSRPKMKYSHKAAEPDCRVYSKLDFSMRTFPHLETLSKGSDLNISVVHDPQKIVIDFNIDAMLRLNSSDWAAYNIASLYWRIVGNGTNALECAKRAVYFSPREQRYIALLNLGTLLQELQSLGEAAIVLHSAVDHDPVQDVSHLALGNVYVALGDFKRSLTCYENVLSLNPRNIRAFQLKHALLCHKKLESGLLEIHSSLQNILKDLQKHNVLHEQWLDLQNQVSWERNGRVREYFSLSQPIYLNLQMLLRTVEHQAKSLNEEVSKKVPREESRKFSLAEGDSSGAKRKQVAGCDGNKFFGNSANHLSKGNTENRKSSAEEDEHEESELENLVSSEYLLTNKIDSLITFIKSDYEEDISLIDYKRKVHEDFNFHNQKSHFSFDRPLLLSDIDACVKDSSNVKKLN